MPREPPVVQAITNEVRSACSIPDALLRERIHVSMTAQFPAHSKPLPNIASTLPSCTVPSAAGLAAWALSSACRHQRYWPGSRRRQHQLNTGRYID